MSKVFELREKLNLTQEQLADKSGISVRTIQRIESGTNPKGHTLYALAKALGVDENVLVKKESSRTTYNYHLIKLINLSSLIFILIPPLTFLVPLIIMHTRKEVNHLTKQIVSIQILWVILSPILFLIISIVEKWFFSGNKLNLAFIMFSILTNIFIILRNSYEIDRNKALYIKLNFSLI